MKFTNLRIQWVLVYFISIIGAWFCIDSGHEFGDDFILYVDQAERFWDHADYQWLQVENKYCMQQSDHLIGPYLYPRGFPFFLSLFIDLKDHLGWESIKFINFLFFLLSSAVFFNRIGNKIKIKSEYLLIIAILVLWNPKIWEASDRLQSDLFFASLVMFFWSVWWTDNGSKWVRWLLLVVLVFWATLTKTNGVLLLLPIGLQVFGALIELVFKPTPESRSYLIKYTKVLHSRSMDGNLSIGFIFGSIGVVFAGVFALWIERSTGANHWEELLGGEVMHVWGSNFFQYWGMLGVLPGWHAINVLKAVALVIRIPEIWVWVPCALLTIGVMIALIKQEITSIGLEISLYIVLNLILLTIWPSQQGVRMLFPIYPLWILLLFLVMQQLGTSWHIRVKKFFISTIGRSIILITLLAQGSMTAMHYFTLDTNRAFSKEMVGLSQFIRDSTERNAVISFFKPRLLRYQTERRVIRLENTVDYSKDKLVLQLPVDINVLLSAGVDYYIVPKEFKLFKPQTSSMKKLDVNSHALSNTQGKSFKEQSKTMDPSRLTNPGNTFVKNDLDVNYPVVFENERFRVFHLRSSR